MAGLPHAMGNYPNLTRQKNKPLRANRKSGL